MVSLQQYKIKLWKTIICLFLLVVLWWPCGDCCGPGRGGGRRRSARKVTPLVYKQHVPNVAENTLGASGLTHGRISRDDPRFGRLVPNYNADILFADDERTGADRLMTERCRERLNILAVSVMNQWPGVRLRVTEGWDEGTMHMPNSLHYEGRAVDITTSDKDYRKQGLLARLAVQSGFDWVYYESRSRVHCSVKSEIHSKRFRGGCFPGIATVETPAGLKKISQLKEGEEIKVLRSDGTFSFSPVLFFLHKDPEGARSFLSLETNTGRILRLTPSHLLFRIKKQDYGKEMDKDLNLVLRYKESILAGSINPGDYVLVRNSKNLVSLERIVNMTSHLGDGVYAPLTSEGTLVVDQIVASCYAVIDSQSIAHWSFLPVRIYYSILHAFNNMWHSFNTDSMDKTNYLNSTNRHINITKNSNILKPTYDYHHKTSQNINDLKLLQKQYIPRKNKLLNSLPSRISSIQTNAIRTKELQSISFPIVKYQKEKLYENFHQIKKTNKTLKRLSKSFKNNKNIDSYKANLRKSFVSPRVKFSSTKGRNSIFDNFHQEKKSNKTLQRLAKDFSYEKYVEADVHIHWYPKLLYSIASWLLPSHLVYS